jgi:hypothetical protein
MDLFLPFLQWAARRRAVAGGCRGCTGRPVGAMGGGRRHRAAGRRSLGVGGTPDRGRRWRRSRQGPPEATSKPVGSGQRPARGPGRCRWCSAWRLRATHVEGKRQNFQSANTWDTNNEKRKGSFLNPSIFGSYPSALPLLYLSVMPRHRRI